MAEAYRLNDAHLEFHGEGIHTRNRALDLITKGQTHGARLPMSDTPNLVIPFVVWPGASPAERTQLLELWTNVILKAGREAASAVAPKPFRLSWRRSARGNWWHDTKTGTSLSSGAMTDVGDPHAATWSASAVPQRHCDRRELGDGRA
jgi:hypothetical protein